LGVVEATTGVQLPAVECTEDRSFELLQWMEEVEGGMESMDT
jgi:hypothetical protein